MKALPAAIRKIKMPDGRVLEVEDAPLDTTLSITKRDIADGVPGDPLHCVIARAGHRELQTEFVAIWKTRGLFEARNGRVYRYMLPPATQRFIEAVDNGLPVKPCILMLRAPSPSKRLGVGNRGGAAGLAKKPGQKTGERTPRVWRGPRGNFSLRGETVVVELVDA